MIICPGCYHEVPDGADLCPNCDEDLTSVDDAIEIEPGSWSIVRTVATDMEARILAGRLIANGVPACVLSQVDTTRGFTVGALAIAKVFVQDHRFEEALAVLAQDDALAPGEYPGEDETEE